MSIVRNYKSEGVKGILRSAYLKYPDSKIIYGVMRILEGKISSEKRREIASFLKNKARVLVVEANDYHCECLPGFIHYFLELGYSVDTLITPKEANQSPLSYSSFNNVRTLILTRKEMYYFLKRKESKSYEYVFFNSSKAMVFEYGCTNHISKLFPKIDSKKLLMVEHAPETLCVSDMVDNKYMVIAKVKLAPRPLFVVPSFFKEQKECKKNSKTEFAIVGSLKGKTYKGSLIDNALAYLKTKGITNFCIRVIGRTGDAKYLSEEYGDMIEFLGFLDYPSMYRQIEKTDYILTLLDPEQHEIFKTVRSSGSYQLIYGFRKPTVIEYDFAECHGYNNENSIVYKGNENLGNALEKAIMLDDDHYQKLKKNLNELTISYEKESLENLRCLLER